MRKFIHVKINLSRINPVEVRKKFGANQEGDRPSLTVVIVWM